MWPDGDQSSNSLPHLRSVVDRLASNSNAEICGAFGHLHGIGVDILASNLMIYAVRMLKYVVLSFIFMELV